MEDHMDDERIGMPKVSFAVPVFAAIRSLSEEDIGLIRSTPSTEISLVLSQDGQGKIEDILAALLVFDPD